MKLFTYAFFGIVLILFSHLSSSEGIKPKAIKGDSVRVERKANKVKGFYLGLKEAAHLRRFEAKGCTFLYEKGLNNHPKNEREYKFERFMISFSGEDAKGETSFDSVLYGHSQFVKNFKPLDFSRGFSPRKITRVELEKGEGAGQIEAERTDLGELYLTFKHTEVYSARNSSFFVPGENREYKVNVHFSQFDANKIRLAEVSVKAFRKIPKKKKEILVDVSCKDFVEPEDSF